MGAPKKADWREERRKRAWELKQQGWQQKDIACALGVSEGAVSQWVKKAREGGEKVYGFAPLAVGGFLLIAQSKHPDRSNKHPGKRNKEKETEKGATPRGNATHPNR